MPFQNIEPKTTHFHKVVHNPNNNLEPFDLISEINYSDRTIKPALEIDTNYSRQVGVELRRKGKMNAKDLEVYLDQLTEEYDIGEREPEEQ